MFDYNKPVKILIYAGTGAGKSTLIRYFLQKIKYDHILILSSFSTNDYDKFREDQKMMDIDVEKIEELLGREGSKCIILDDILHLKYRSPTAMQPLIELLSTNRHKNVNCIISTQLLSYIGKAFPALCEYYITREFTEDSLKELVIRARMSKKELLEIGLDDYQFLVADHKMNLHKIKVKVNAVYTEIEPAGPSDELPSARVALG